MKLYWHLLRRYFAHLSGAVVCWQTGRHVEMWEAGLGPPSFGAPWGEDPPPQAVYRERTYCIRCGVVLKEGTP